MPETLPQLVLFSGLAADVSLFTPQQIAFPTLIVPKWPIPHSNDSLDSYAKQIASELQTHRPCILGGASFGGVIAMHVAKYLQPQCVLLIGSMREPAEHAKSRTEHQTGRSRY